MPPWERYQAGAPAASPAPTAPSSQPAGPWARFGTPVAPGDVEATDADAFLAANPTYPTYMRGTTLQPIGNRRNIPAATGEQRAARAPEAELGDWLRYGSGLAFLMDSLPAMLGDPGGRRRQEELNARISNTLSGANADAGVGEIMMQAPPATPASEGLPGWLRDEGRNWATAFRFAMDNNELHRAETIRAQYPQAEFRRDARGHLQARYSPTSEWAYINRPGISITDATDLAGTLIRYLPASRAAALPRTFTGRAMTAGGASALTEWASQNLAGLVSGGPGADGGDVVTAGLGGTLGQTMFDTVLGLTPAVSAALRHQLGIPAPRPTTLPDPVPQGVRVTPEPVTPAPTRRGGDTATRATPDEIAALENELANVRANGPSLPREITDRPNLDRQLREGADTLRLNEGNQLAIAAARDRHAADIADLEARIAAARRPYFDDAASILDDPTRRSGGAGPGAWEVKDGQLVPSGTPEPPTIAAPAIVNETLSNIGRPATIDDVAIGLMEGRAGAYVVDPKGNYHALGQAGHATWHEQFTGANGGTPAARSLGDFLADTGTAEISTAYKSIGIRIGEHITNRQLAAINRVMRDFKEYNIVLEVIPRGAERGKVFQGIQAVRGGLATAGAPRAPVRAGPLSPPAPPPAPPPPPPIAPPPVATAPLAPTSPLSPLARLRRALDAAGAAARASRDARNAKLPPQDRPAPARADVRAAFDEQRIPASRGQITQDVRARQREDDLLQSAEPRALSFADEQAAAIDRRAQEIATRGQPAVSGGIEDAGEVVRSELQAQFQQIDDLASATYDRAFQNLDSVRPIASEDEVLRTVDNYLRNGADIDNPMPTGFGLDRLEGYTAPTRALRIIEDLQERVARGTEFSDVARVRQALRKLSRDATHNDVEPMMLIRQGYDRWVRDSLKRAQTFRIRTPQEAALAAEDAANRARAMELIDEADAIWSERQRLFSASHGRDPAGVAIERLRDPSTQITGTQIINSIFGSGKLPAPQALGALRRLRAASMDTTPQGRIQPVDAGPTRAAEAFNDPEGVLTPTMQALREAFWHRIREPLRRRRPGTFVPARAMAEQLDTALNGAGASITRVLHTKAEIESMRQLLQVLKYVERPIGVNTSGTAITMRRMMQGAIDGLASSLPRGIAFIPRLFGLFLGRNLDDLGRAAQAQRAFSRPALDVDFGSSQSGTAYGQLGRDGRSDRGSQDPASRAAPTASASTPAPTDNQARGVGGVTDLMSAAAGTITFQDSDGYWVTLPTIVNDQQMRPATAIEAWRAGSLGALSMSEDKAEAIAAARAYRSRPATVR